MLRDMRSQAVRARGYLYGETLAFRGESSGVRGSQRLGQPGTLGSVAGDSFRQKMNERIDGLLSRPSKARVFEDAVYKPTPVARGSNKA